MKVAKGKVMTKLSELPCEACNKHAKLLSLSEIEELLTHVEGWHVINDSNVQKLTRQFKTKSYKESVLFTNAVATLAGSVNHHPQIIMEYSLVTVVWWSHNIKGLHKNDFIMAAKTSDLL